MWSQDMTNVQLGPEVRVHRMNDPGVYPLVPLTQRLAHRSLTSQSVANKRSSFECPMIHCTVIMLPCEDPPSPRLCALPDTEANCLFTVVRRHRMP
jgi:hypothetical protein